MKRCAKCGETKSLTAFHRQAAQADGYRPRCKQCRKPESRAWYVENAEVLKDRSARWRKDNPEWYRAQLAGWAERNREYKRETGRAYHDANRDKIKEYAARPERRVAARLNAKTQKAKRKAHMSATVVPITPEQWQEIQASYCGLCVYCHKPVSDPTMDHVRPLNGGGDHSTVNIVPACARCNHQKNDRPLLIFLLRRRADKIAA